VNEGTSSNFDLRALYEVKARMESILGGRKLLVGIVCRPEMEAQVRRIAEREALPKGFEPFGQIPIYADSRQVEPWLAFYDRELLKVYLDRHNPRNEHDTRQHDPADH
jgi:hypothetical protein